MALQEYENGVAATGTCVVEVSRGEALAGAPVTLTARATCTPPADLRGQALSIRDARGAELGTLSFVDFDGESSETDEIELPAPDEAGEHTWQAVLAEHVADGVRYPGMTVPVTVVSTAHAMNTTVWDIPDAVTPGETFTIRIGMRCSAGCVLTGREALAVTQDGAIVGRGVAGDQPWRGTKALYVAEVALTAPAVPGLQGLAAEVRPAAGGAAHEAGSTRFSLRVVERPECTVTVEAIASDTLKPVEGAIVVIHPYRAKTDAAGIARLGVRKGRYLVQVSANRFDPMSRDVEVNEDLTTRVVLPPEPPDPDVIDMY